MECATGKTIKMTKDNKMKKLISVFTAAVMALGVFAGCNASVKNDKLTIVTTIFPEYDWVRNVVGDKDIDIELLLDNGADLHSYQPTTEDVLKISTCDLFIYVGGESDEWVKDALKQATNKDMKVIDLMDVMGDSAYEEELKEGMEGEEEEEEEEEGEVEYDEHVWLSLKNTQKFVRVIADDLKEIDPDNASDYEANASAYIEKLVELDGKYETLISGSSVDTLVFGDRFPFRYMTEDYGLDYYAAFVGCSAETEASFETISFLTEKTDELGLKYIFTIENSDQKIANTVISNTASGDQEILVLNSMQATDQAAIDAGETYLGIMESNYEVLAKALG